jgi:uncharacterized protein YjbJ (UPF0337 family)
MGELRDKVEGEVKDTGGKLSGDKKMEWEGKGQKAKGKLEEAGREMTQGDPTPEEPVREDKGL